MPGKRSAVLLLLIVVSGISLAAQQPPEAGSTAELRLTGIVRTTDGTPIPGSTLRVIQTTTGKTWVSWTDENGKFDLPGLPGGHFRVEVSQLGFALATREFDLTAVSKSPVEVKLDVATLAALAASRAPKEIASNPPTASPANASPQSESAVATLPATTGTATSQPSADSRSARNGGPPSQGGEPQRQSGLPFGGGGGRQVGGPRSFQQVGLNGNGQDQTNAEANDAATPVTDPGPLGQSSSSDAFLMSGTVRAVRLQIFP